MSKLFKRLNWDNKRNSEPQANRILVTYNRALYSNNTVLPFSTSSSNLCNWLSTNHPDYNMSSWCFYGNIETNNIGTIALSSIVQQQLDFPNSQPPYLSEFSFCENNSKGYNLTPFMLYDKADVQFNTPFSIKTNLLGKSQLERIELSIISGIMGQKGAQYKLCGEVIDLNDVIWNYEVLLIDELGAVQIGYGPLSFLPQWLTEAQRTAITCQYNNNIQAYLADTNDAMLGQGSYYYSLPLLKLNSFTLKKNNVPYATAHKGNIWVDYVVQGFAAQDWSILENASWQFFAIQFPELNNTEYSQAALMVSIVTTTQNGIVSSLPVAKFYNNVSDARTPNSALKPAFEWNMNQIKFTPTIYWTDSKGKKFPVAFDLILDAPNGKITIHAQAFMDNQVISQVEKYEGIFSVTASIHVNKINETNAQGYCWAEVH